MRMTTSSVLGVLLAGCLAVTAAEAAAKSYRIGLVLPDLSNEAIADINTGAQARAKELGSIEVLTTGSYSGEEQAKAVENYVAAGVDLIAYDSIDAAAVGPAIVKANKAGIPVIAVISAASSGEYATFITPDFREDGRIIGRWMAKALGGKGHVAHVEGNPADEAGANLTGGFKEGLAEGGINSLVASAPSDWDREKALNVATDILTANPDLQGMYGANDDVAMGALQAIKAANRKASVLLAGHNGTCEALASMLKGDLDFTVMLFNKPLGVLMVDTAVMVFDKKPVEKHIAAPVLGLDAKRAQALLAGSGEMPPANIAPEVMQRLEAAKAGCKK